MNSLFELVNILAMLIAARRLQWTLQTNYTGLPADGNAGVPLNDAPRAVVHVVLRENIARPASLVTVTVADAASSYTITVNGNTTSAVTGEATIAGVADALVTELEAVTLITDVADIIRGAADGEITIRSKSETPLTVSVSATGGSGAMTVTNDATAASVRIYGLPKGAPGWVLLRNGDLGAITTSGIVERFNTSGLERLYVELYSVTGDNAYVRVGPAIEETTAG